MFQNDEPGYNVNLERRNLLGRKQFISSGKCLTDGEFDYYSPSGLYAKNALETAPDGTKVVLFSYIEGAESKTLIGDYLARYFRKKL